jgi:acyl-CoA thioesterase YciA
MDRVEFKAPIHVGDVVNLYATVTKFGTKSITIMVEVEAERFTTGETVPVTAATMTMVSIDASGMPIPFRSPPTV